MSLRKSFLPLLIFIGFYLAGLQPALSQHLVYNMGDPSPEEQYIMELINRARANPTAEGVRLGTTTDPDVSSEYKSYQSQGPPFADRSSVQSSFATYTAKPPIAFNKKLMTAAIQHSQDMLTNNYSAHDSPFDQSTTFSRINDAGYLNDGYNENIWAYGKSLTETHQGLEIDFGKDRQATLQDRQNIIGYAGTVFSEAGISILHSAGGAGHVGPYITTEDFGHNSETQLITGVVYGDDNGNNFYDIGEGLPGVKITFSGSTDTSAVTSTSGGYALPYNVYNSYSITASGGALKNDITHVVTTFDGGNIKIDFVQTSGTGYPQKPVLTSPALASTVNNASVTFQWNAVSGATGYHFQLSTDTLFFSGILHEATLDGSTTSTSFSGLIGGTKYFWRVQASNNLGMGQFSVGSFSVLLPGAPITLISPADGSNAGQNDVTLKWNPAVPPATLYWVQVSTDQAFSNLVIDNNSLTATSFLVAKAKLQTGTTYYWHVQAKNDAGWNSPSNTWSFTTGTSAVRFSDLSIPTMVTPNPSSGVTHIKFTLDNPANVSLKIFSITGKEECAIAGGELSSGEHDITWTANTMPAGIYLYELSIGSSREVGRIVLVK